MTSWAACMMRSHFSGGTAWSALLATAAAYLTSPMAMTKGRGRVTPLMGKFSRARPVWAA